MPIGQWFSMLIGQMKSIPNARNLSISVVQPLDFRWTSEYFRFSNFTLLQWRQREANFGLDEFKD